MCNTKYIKKKKHMGKPPSTTIAGVKHSGLVNWHRGWWEQGYSGIGLWDPGLLLCNPHIVPWKCFKREKSLHIKNNYFYRTYCLFQSLVYTTLLYHWTRHWTKYDHGIQLPSMGSWKTLFSSAKLLVPEIFP